MSEQLPDLKQILALLSDGDWAEAHLRFGDFELTVSSTAGAVAPITPAVQTASSTPPTSPTTAAPAVGDLDAGPPATPSTDSSVGSASAVETSDDTVVTAASLGVFWRSPQPGASPFVEVGDTVAPDTTVCILEVMKLMTHVKAECHGVVRAIHVDNGAMVEYGDPLVSIEPR